MNKMVKKGVARCVSVNDYKTIDNSFDDLLNMTEDERYNLLNAATTGQERMTKIVVQDYDDQVISVRNSLSNWKCIVNL